MQKVIGSVIIIAVCTAIGFDKSRELGRHVKELEELQRIFTLIQSELQYSRLPLTELFAKIAMKTEAMYKRWLGNISQELKDCNNGIFEEIWQSSIETHFKETHLTKEELDDLRQIGKNLSCAETLSLYLSQLEISIQNTREEEKNKKKLYQSMGIMTGVFLVIVLV